MALFSFIKIIAKINKLTHILDYRNNVALNQRMPNANCVGAEIPLESKIGKTLSERTTKTVVMLVLVMLFLLPAFYIETWITAPTQFALGLK